MADIKVYRAHDTLSSDKHIFSLVVSKSHCQYVFPEGGEFFDSDTRVKRLLKFHGKRPKSIDGWFKLAKNGFDYVVFEEYTFYADDLDFEEYVSLEKESLSVVSRPISPASQRIEQALRNLAERDADIAVYLTNNFDSSVVQLSEDKLKILYTTIIVAADTVEFNPWLISWINGFPVDYENCKLVLERPQGEVFVENDEDEGDM